MKVRASERWTTLAVLVLGVAAASGCSPKIGDKCSVSTDCSQAGDRLCDPTQPDGYCTVFNCEPNGCPDDSLCVSFNDVSCSNAAMSMRFQRTFCMATCQKNGDCRSGYVCLDTTNDAVRQVVDVNPSTRSICAVQPVTTAPMSDPAVCLPPDGGTGAGGPDGAVDGATDGATDAPAFDGDATDGGGVSFDSSGDATPE
jgi:hypothetical protein